MSDYAIILIALITLSGWLVAVGILWRHSFLTLQNPPTEQTKLIIGPTAIEATVMGPAAAATIRPDPPPPALEHCWGVNDNDEISCLHCRAGFSLTETPCPRSSRMITERPSCDYRRMVHDEITAKDYARRLAQPYRKERTGPTAPEPDEVWQDFMRTRTIH